VHRLILVLILMCAAPAWTQDSDNDSDTEVEEDVQEEQPVAEDGVEDESYADTEEDDFRPSEEIPADQSIPFPTDI
jgi:hypothetical protein